MPGFCDATWTIRVCKRVAVVAVPALLDTALNTVLGITSGLLGITSVTLLIGGFATQRCTRPTNAKFAPQPGQRSTDGRETLASRFRRLHPVRTGSSDPGVERSALETFAYLAEQFWVCRATALIVHAIGRTADGNCRWRAGPPMNTRGRGIAIFASGAALADLKVGLVRRAGNAHESFSGNSMSAYRILGPGMPTVGVRRPRFEQ